MQNELKVGNVEDIINALAEMPNIHIKNGTVTVYTDTTEVDTLRAECNVAREKARKVGMNADKVLCSYQQREYGMGAWRYTLGTNIYGYAVGDSLRSNIGGGRWNQMTSGASFSEAIVWGCRQAKNKNVTFSFPLKVLPEEVIEAVVDDFML